MSKSRGEISGSRRGSGGVAFLLAQLGAHASARFAERIATIPLAPAEAGILRKISTDEGISQQVLAKHLGVMPSRIVQLIDGLEERKLVERRRSVEDRRNYQLKLTKQGREVIQQVSRIAAEHEREICQNLNAEEREKLLSLCHRVAAQLGLTPGVHPGYRKSGER